MARRGGTATQRLFVRFGVFVVLVALPSAVVLAGAWGYLYGIGHPPSLGAAGDVVGPGWLAAASAVGVAVTALGVFAAGRGAILALAWRPLLPMIFFMVLAAFWALAAGTREIHLWALFPCVVSGGFAFGVGMAVSKDEGAIRWAAEQEWSRDRSRGVPPTASTSLAGVTPRDAPTHDRAIRECREGAPDEARRRNVLAEAAFAAGAAAVPTIPWLAAYWLALL